MNRLDSLQQEVLNAFFKYESRFFLTGGAALAGFHLQHRTTKDLDLFTVEDRIEEGAAALATVARDVGGSLESLVVYARLLLSWFGIERPNSLRQSPSSG